MAQQKYVKVGGVWKPVTAEYGKIGGAWKPAVTNYAKIGGDWKPVPFEKFVFVCEDISSRLYAVDDTPAVVTGWPKYGSDGHGETISGVNDVACGKSSRSYFACDNGVYQVEKDGTITWRYDMTAGYSVNCVVTDADGNVYAADGAGLLVKLDDSGGLLWSHAFAPNIVYSLVVDYAGGYVYAGIGTSEKAIYRCLISNGATSRALTVTGYGTPTGLAIVSGVPDLLVGTASGFVFRWNASAGYVWGAGAPLGSGAGVESVRYGHDGYVYASNASGSVYKLAYTNGTAAWVHTGTGCAAGLSVDLSGNVYAAWYVAGSSTTNNCVRKLSKLGALLWTWRPYLNAQMLSVAVTPGIKSAGF